MIKIGIVACDNTFTKVYIWLYREREKLVKLEDIVLIKNLAGNELLCVVRDGDEPDEKAFTVVSPDGTLPHTLLFVQVIGEVPSKPEDMSDSDYLTMALKKKVKNMKSIIPESPVYILE